MSYNMPSGMSNYTLGQTTNTYNRGVDATTMNNLVSFFNTVFPKNNDAMPAGKISGNVGRNKEKPTLDDALEGVAEQISNTIERSQFISGNFYYKLLPLKKGKAHQHTWHTMTFSPKLPTPLAPRARPRLLNMKKRNGATTLTRQGIGFEIDLETLHVTEGQTWYLEHLTQAVVSVESGNKFSILWKILVAHNEARVYLTDRQFVMTVGIPALYDRARENFGHAQKHPMPLQNAMRRLREEADKMRVTSENIAVLCQLSTLGKLAETKDRYTKYSEAGDLAIRALEMGGQAFMKMFDGAEVYAVQPFYTENGELNIMRTLTRCGLYYMAISPYATAGVTSKRNASSRDMRIYDFDRRRKQELRFKLLALGTDRYNRVTGELNKFDHRADWAALDPALRGAPAQDQFLYEDAMGKTQSVDYWGQMRTDLWTTADMLDLAGSCAQQLPEPKREQYNTALDTLFEALAASEQPFNNDISYAVYLYALRAANPGVLSHTAGSGEWGGVPPLYTVSEIARQEASGGLVLPDYSVLKTEIKAVLDALDVGAVVTDADITGALATRPGGGGNPFGNPVSTYAMTLVDAVAPAAVGTPAARKVAAKRALQAVLAVAAREFPAGFATAAGFEEIARIYRSQPGADTAKYGVSQKWAERITAAISPLTLLAQKLNAEFGNNLATNVKYAASWMYHPRPVDVFVDTLTRHRPVLWLGGAANAAAPAARTVTAALADIDSIKEPQEMVLQVINDANTALANSASAVLVAYQPQANALETLRGTPNGPNKVYEAVAKQALLARLMMLVAPTKRGAATSNQRLLDDAAQLGAYFPPTDFVNGPERTLRDVLAHLQNAVPANLQLFASKTAKSNLDELDNIGRVLEDNRAAVIALIKAADANGARRGADVAQTIGSVGPLYRSSVTISPPQFKQLASILATMPAAGVIAVPSSPLVNDTPLTVAEVTALSAVIGTANARKQPLSLQPLSIRAAVNEAVDFGPAHRVTLINHTVNNGAMPTAASPVSQPQAQQMAFANIVSANMGQSGINATIDSRGSVVSAPRPAFLAAAQRSAGSARFMSAAAAATSAAAQPVTITPEQQLNQVRFRALGDSLRTLDVAVARLVNEHFAERYAAAFEHSMDKLQLAFALAFMTTPNNFHDSLGRWLDCGYDVPFNVLVSRDFYAYTHTLIRMVAGLRTGGFIQGQQNTWWGFDAGRGCYGLYHTYYCAPYIERPENIQKMDGFDLDGYAYGGGTSIRSGRAHAMDPNGQHPNGEDLVCYALPPSQRDLPAVWSPHGKLGVTNQQSFANAPFVDQQFVNTDFEKWRLKLEQHKNDRNYDADDIVGAVMAPATLLREYYEDHAEYKDGDTGDYNTYRPARGPWKSCHVDTYMRDVIDGKACFRDSNLYENWRSI
jgi:hypothetical protein